MTAALLLPVPCDYERPDGSRCSRPVAEDEPHCDEHMRASMSDGPWADWEACTADPCPSRYCPEHHPRQFYSYGPPVEPEERRVSADMLADEGDLDEGYRRMVLETRREDDAERARRRSVREEFVEDRPDVARGFHNIGRYASPERMREALNPTPGPSLRERFAAYCRSEKP